MNAVPMIEDARSAVHRLFAKPGYRVTGCHRYNDAEGRELFRVARLKHPQADKIIRPMHRDGARYRTGRPERPATGWPLYVPPYPLVETEPVFVVEGEACADALARQGLTAVTSGSADSADTADWTPLQGRRVRLWPDHDGAGARYADKVEARLRALGCVMERIDVMPLNLPDKGDCVDWLQVNPLATADDVLALGLVASPPVAGRSAPEPLPDPLPSVPIFNMALLPDALRDWCDDLAGGLQVPADFLAVPALVAMAGALGGRRLAVKMKAHANWYERPVLWGCVIGRPSSGKSPALAPARRMLERLNDDERNAWENEQAQHAAMQMVAEGQHAAAKDAIRKALKQGDMGKANALAEAAQVKVEDAPPEPRIVVNDATVEKLGELLNANPRGLVQFRDELAGWLASLDREGRESDRAFWLECWNGAGHYTVDRIGRGTIRIEACAVSMLGGMQPGKLAEYVRGAIRGGFADDGLMQRFQLAVFPDLPGTWRYTDTQPDPVAEAKAWAAFKRLRTLDPASIGAESMDACDVPFLRLGDEAQGLFIEWYTELMQRLRAGGEPAFMESHLAKYPALAGRLALVLHLADNGNGPVSGDAMARALGWCDYLEGHARRIYAPGSDNGLTAAHALLRKRADLPDGFTARAVYRRCWSGLNDPDTVAEALGVLVEYGHLHESAEQTGGRPMMAYRWAS